MGLSPLFVRLTRGNQDLNGLLLFILINDVGILCFVERASRNNHVKKNQLDAQLILSIFRQHLHVSGVSRPFIRRYNHIYIQHLVIVILFRWQNKLYIKLVFLYTNDVWVWGVFFSLYQLVRDSKVRIGGSCSRMKALHDRFDCLITVKDNLSLIQR